MHFPSTRKEHSMQITFDPTNKQEALATRSLIDSMYPRVTPAVDVSITSPTRQVVLAPADMPDAGQTVPPLPPVVNAALIPPGPVPLAPVPGAIELDSRGLPWDGRIHSSTKKKTDAGQWVWRKGMAKNQTIINAVEAELRATLPQAQPQAATPGPVFPQAPAVAPTVTLPPIPVATAPTPGALPVPPVIPAPAPALPPAPPVPVANAPIPGLPQLPSAPATFAELTQALSPMMTAGKVTPDTITMACMQAGVPGMVGLTSATPEQIAAIFKTLSA
jgi:hypothetical protein